MMHSTGQSIKSYSATNPLLIFGSRHGSIYNLTPSNLEHVNVPAIHLSVGDFIDNKNNLKNLPENLSFKKFLGFKDDTKVKTYLSPFDFYKSEPITGCQNSKLVKIKCLNGYNAISAELYDQMVSIIRPDIVVGLTEYPSVEKDHKSESNKSYKRAINKTTTYLQQSKLNRQKSLKAQEANKQQSPSKQSDYKPIRLVAIHGAKNLSLVTRSLELVLQEQFKSDIDGLLICDVCQGESIEEREEIYSHVLNRLKHEDKKFILGLPGLGKIQDIEHARKKFGFSYFQVNYPFYLAENHRALIKKSTDLDKDQGFEYIEKVPVRHQNLEPLDKCCSCEACERHSESYIAHLIECHEMTASVLLSIHNMHVYQEYLRTFGQN